MIGPVKQSDGEYTKGSGKMAVGRPQDPIMDASIALNDEQREIYGEQKKKVVLVLADHAKDVGLGADDFLRMIEVLGLRDDMDELRNGSD